MLTLVYLPTWCNGYKTLYQRYRCCPHRSHGQGHGVLHAQAPSLLERNLLQAQVQSPASPAATCGLPRGLGVQGFVTWPSTARMPLCTPDPTYPERPLRAPWPRTQAFCPFPWLQQRGEIRCTMLRKNNRGPGLHLPFPSCKCNRHRSPSDCCRSPGKTIVRRGSRAETRLCLCKTQASGSWGIWPP